METRERGQAVAQADIYSRHGSGYKHNLMCTNFAYTILYMCPSLLDKFQWSSCRYISFLPSPLNTHTDPGFHTKRKPARRAVIQQVREEERARRGIDHLIKAEKEAAKQRYKRLLKEVDDEVELLMHHTRRGYDFHPTGAPLFLPRIQLVCF